MFDCDSSLFMNKDEPSQCKVSGIISLSSNMFDFSHICHQFLWLGLFLADGDKLDPWFNSAFNYLAHWKRNILHSTTFIWGITYSRKREKTVWEFCSKNSDFCWEEEEWKTDYRPTFKLLRLLQVTVVLQKKRIRLLQSLHGPNAI